MKTFFRLILILILLALAIAWLFFTSATNFEQKNHFIYIKPGEDAKTQVLAQLEKDNVIRNISLFNFAAGKAGAWDKLKPGRFEIKKGESLFNIMRMFRNNSQSPVKLIINKLRTKEDLAKLISKDFAVDSSTIISFLLNNDSLKQFDADTNTVMALIIPDTYLFNWNTSLKNILQRLKTAHDAFWNANDRTQKATAENLTPLQVYTLASIVEEETNKDDDKGNIASVYINRYNKNMYLGADPTIKYALRDFSLKRILFGHLTVVSPYNTYKNKGLPPGPICTPSTVTIDAVLNAPKTDYIFFVAKSDFSGYHHFSSTYAEHEQYAKEYQKALDEWMAKKQNQNP